MRMMVSLHENGVLGNIDTVGEIGPGDSLATGLAMLLSGANRYIGLDVVPTAHNFDNDELLDEMVKLFKQREPIPDATEQPKSRPYLFSYVFPSHILTDEKLSRLLSDERIGNIRQAMHDLQEGRKGETSNPIHMEYLVPWDKEALIEAHEQTADLIISNAVMEHVDEVPVAYQHAYRLLKPQGVIASVIDYKCHGTAGLWNGHWAYTDLAWKIVRGRCSYFINRWSHSMHVDELRKLFAEVREVRYIRENALEKKDITPRFASLPATDFETGEGFIIAVKK